MKAKQDTPLPEILAAFHDSYQQLLRMVESLTEADLADDNTYTHLVNNTGNHYAEHRQWIKAELNKKGSSITRP